jgi:sigma-B regulation protein RsbU (phosphoserine phosphatase)
MGREPLETPEPLRVLVVDDSPSDRLMAVRVLKRAFPGIQLVEVGEEPQWHQVLGLDRFDAVLVDYLLPWTTGLDLLHDVQRRWPGIPVIMLTGTAEEWQALEAVQEGLEEYLPKTPESYSVLPRALRFALERTRQRQALVESNETLHLVIEGVHGHAILMLDAERRIASWNAGAQAITGYAEREVLGHSYRELLVPAELRDTAVDKEMETAEHEGVYTGEGWRSRRDGSHFWADITVSALHKEGGALRGFIVVLRDATERRRMEEEQRRANEFRERLLGIVSHDLRSPLQAIMLQSQLLSRQVNDPKVKNATTRINHGAERMTRMIADLLDFTRGRLGGGIPVERRPDDLFLLTAEVIEELQLTAPQNPIVLRTQGNGYGEWDRDRLIQVVQNLVTNAVKHGAQGMPVQVTLTGTEEGVVMCVQNQGQPIPPEFVPHLFDPFRRAGGGGKETSDPMSGLGLGLYIAQEIVHAHGGTIHVASDMEDGTTFTLHLPRKALHRNEYRHTNTRSDARKVSTSRGEEHT